VRCTAYGLRLLIRAPCACQIPQERLIPWWLGSRGPYKNLSIGLAGVIRLL
jgi:hypothetical protein